MIHFNSNKKHQQAASLAALSFFFFCLAYFYPAGGSAAEDQTSLWQAVRSGDALVLMRHAIAPGTGDPETFTIGKCQTQRNLSEDGRRQARAIGDRFRANGIHQANVFSSQWCRCLETAELLGLGPVEELRVLNSFFQNYERRDTQTAGLKSWIALQNLDQPTVLVTHQVNITGLTQIYPGSGEMIVVKRSESGALAVLGRIETD
jgi:phosphohistidine phosphatase SixA